MVLISLRVNMTLYCTVIVYQGRSVSSIDTIESDWWFGICGRGSRVGSDRCKGPWCNSLVGGAQGERESLSCKHRCTANSWKEENRRIRGT